LFVNYSAAGASAAATVVSTATVNSNSINNYSSGVSYIPFSRSFSFYKIQQLKQQQQLNLKILSS
jgi:hypothetical protein